MEFTCRGVEFTVPRSLCSPPVNRNKEVDAKISQKIKNTCTTECRCKHDTVERKWVSR